MKLKVIIQIILTSIVFTFLTILSGCGKNVEINVGMPPEIFVEYGESIAFEKAELIKGNEPFESEFDISMTLFDADSNEIIVRGNLFTPEIGEYKLVYSIPMDGVKDYVVKILCRDTKAPEIKFNDFVIEGVKGDRIPLPHYVFSDMSGIDATTVTWKLTFNGLDVLVEDETFLAENVGEYKLNIQCADNVGNKFNKTYSITIAEPYSDTDLADTSLFEFDDLGYVNLVKRELTSDTQSTYEVVTDINKLPSSGDKSFFGGALKLSLVDSSDLKLKFISPKTINPKSYGDGINYVYVDLYADGFVNKALWLDIDGNEIAKAVNVKQGWVKMSFPLSSLGSDFKDFYMRFNSDEATFVYIDKIYFGVKKNDIHQGQEDIDGNIIITDMCAEDYVMDDVIIPNGDNLGSTTLYQTDKPNALEYVEGSHKGIAFTRNNSIGVRSGFMYMFDNPLQMDDFAKIMIDAYTETVSQDMWWGVVVGTKCYYVGDINKAGEHTYTIYKSNIETLPNIVKDYPTGVTAIDGVYFYSYKDKDENFANEYTVIIEKICYADKIWSDDNLAEHYIADFDEKGYVDMISTSRGYAADIVSPNSENISDIKHTTNILKITGGEAWQYGVLLSLQNALSLENVYSLNFEMYLSSNIPNGNLVMQLYSSDGGVKYFNLSNLAGETDEWITVAISKDVIDATSLKQGETFTDISNIAFSVNKVGLISYIDSIFYIDKSEAVITNENNKADFSQIDYSPEVTIASYGSMPASVQDETHVGDSLTLGFSRQWARVSIIMKEKENLSNNNSVYINIYTSSAMQVGIKFMQDGYSDFICDSTIFNLVAGWNLIEVNTTYLKNFVSGKTSIGYVYIQSFTSTTATVYIHSIYFDEPSEDPASDKSTNANNLLDYSNYTYSTSTNEIATVQLDDIKDENHIGDAIKANFTAQWASICVGFKESVALSNDKIVKIIIYTTKAIELGVKFAQNDSTDYVCDGTNLVLSAGWNMLEINMADLPNLRGEKTEINYIFLQLRTNVPTTIYIHNVYCDTMQ